MAKESQKLREANRRYDNRRNGFGQLASGTVHVVSMFVDIVSMNPHGYPEGHVLNLDLTPYVAQNSDGTPKTIQGLDIPPIR